MFCTFILFFLCGGGGGLVLGFGLVEAFSLFLCHGQEMIRLNYRNILPLTSSHSAKHEQPHLHHLHTFDEYSRRSNHEQSICA